MDIKELNTELSNLLHNVESFVEEQLNELRPEDAGEEITDFIDYEDALNKIKQRYDNNEALAYCPDAETISYNGKDYKLAVVLGVSKKTKGGMLPHGTAHFLHKHTYTSDDGLTPTPEDLIEAAKNVKVVLEKAIEEKEKLKKNDKNKTTDIAFDPFENKLIFTNGKYIYIVCLAKNQEELTYLHNLFTDDKTNYVKRQQEKIDKALKKEIPPSFT